MVAAPPNVSVFVPKLIALVELVMDKVPASTLILASLFNVTTPLNKLAPEIFLIAPSPLTPPPLILIITSATDMLFCNCNAAPDTILVFPDVAPNAPPF